ncbi:uncharacterized protein LOC112048327 isoform X2 [Bicyclus anynana]|uniref:Uncharacterized protein LOC112048327 isoform X2 n=1 Tax=Bicyclus anynana TaxID=110368 RepID=A0A6J1N3W8_BICAN|nr:uncharacterized protein LOC112048327 isoform X2 [Bicyclus anynana]
MEDVFALVVLTLLQLCRGQMIQPEWFAANLVNQDPGYTPKPITEIFTSDSPFTPKNPALFTQPPTVASSPLPPASKLSSSVAQNINPASQNGESPRGTPEIMSQVVDNSPKTDLPNFLIVFDPRGPVNENIQPPIPSSRQPLPETTPVQNKPTTAIVSPSTTQSTTAMPPSLGTLPPFPQGVPPQILSTLSPPIWPLNSMFLYPILPFNRSVTPAAPVTPTIVPNLSPIRQPARPLAPKPTLTVRVKAPRGSITKLHINPTTTVRPTTTRRRKSNRRTNNYETCVNSCSGKKEPICSSPMGVNPIDPDRLKGFPSLCHMACHNSFKRDLYQKVANGRCGKLRTRIRPVDKNKLNREELNKAQYTIVHNSPETVVEFSPVRH